jgi:hypothetical protein
MSVELVKRTLGEACVVALASALVALSVNAARSNGLPLVASKEYTTIVPCPEPVGDAKPLGPEDEIVVARDTLLIDARTQLEFEAWHLPGAMHLEFDWLGPPPDKEVATVAARVAARGYRHIVVYGDGADPDSGREWARLLAGARIKHVYFVAGGAPALRRHFEGAAP